MGLQRDGDLLRETGTHEAARGNGVVVPDDTEASSAVTIFSLAVCRGGMDRGFGAVLVEDAEFISALFSSQDFGKGGQRGPVIPLLRVQFTTAYKNLETKRSQEAINLASLHLCPRFCNWEANFMKMGAKGDQNGFSFG
jgi:hypothetical protein